MKKNIFFKEKKKTKIFPIILFMGILLFSWIEGNKFLEKNNSLVNERIQKETRAEIIFKESEIERLKKIQTVLLKKEKDLEVKILSQKKRMKVLNLLLVELDKAKYQKEAFGIAFSESRFKRNIIHPSAPNRVVGMGGIDLVYWGKPLKNKGIDPNGLLAIDYVYQVYMSETKNKQKALENYKGTVKNRYSYNLTKKYIDHLDTSNLYKKLLESHKKTKDLNNLLSL